MAKQFITTSHISQGSQVDETGGNVKVDKPMVLEVCERQDSASEEMLIVDHTKLAPPGHSIPRATTPDLFPDNMESRFVGLPSRAHSPGIEDLSFDRMSSRIGGSSVAV